MTNSESPASPVWPVAQPHAIHPHATAINADDAIAAIDSGAAAGFLVDYRPGDDPFFYLALANRPPTDIPGKPTRLWGLIGINQPGTDAAGTDINTDGER